MSADDPEHRPRGAVWALLGGIDRLRAHPRALFVSLAAGACIAVIDQLRRGDPVSATEFVGVLDGHISITLSIPVLVDGTTSTPLGALVGLRLRWFVWLAGLQITGFLASAGAGMYVLSRVQEQSLTAGVVGRYFVFVGLFGLPSVQFEGAALWLGVPVLVVGTVLAVRLFLVAGLIVEGDSLVGAGRASWRRTRGYGWTILAVLVVLGLGNHLLLSVPLLGPVGSGLIGALHAGAIGTVLDWTAHSGTENTSR